MSEPKRILLAVTGLSPQTLTETLFALAVQKTPPWIPHEVHLLTTAPGATRARLALLSEDHRAFQRLRADYDLPHIAFDESHIHVLRDSLGHPLQDIRSPADNERAADRITELVRRFTTDPAGELHASIAGGRKTLGYYLGYAMSLFGREQDRLSHVLVEEPFESTWGFFYPTPYSHVIETRDGGLADTRDARIALAEIPFVRLRHGLDSRLLEGEASFSEAVEAANRSLAPPRLVIDLTQGRVAAAGMRLELPPKELALLSLFARRRKQGRPPLAAPHKEVPDPKWARRFLAEYSAIRHGELDDLQRTRKALARGMDQDYFSSTKSKLHRHLRQKLGQAARAYLIDDGGTRPRRYALRLPPDAIHFGKLAAPDKQPPAHHTEPENCTGNSP